MGNLWRGGGIAFVADTVFGFCADALGLAAVDLFGGAGDNALFAFLVGAHTVIGAGFAASLDASSGGGAVKVFLARHDTGIVLAEHAVFAGVGFGGPLAATSGCEFGCAVLVCAVWHASNLADGTSMLAGCGRLGRLCRGVLASRRFRTRLVGLALKAFGACRLWCGCATLCQGKNSQQCRRCAKGREKRHGGASLIAVVSGFCIAVALDEEGRMWKKK
jgi:hypothetical protein